MLFLGSRGKKKTAIVNSASQGREAATLSGLTDEQLWHRPDQRKRSPNRKGRNSPQHYDDHNVPVSSMEKALEEYRYWSSRAGKGTLAGANVFVLAEEVDRGNERDVSEAITKASMAIDAMGGQRSRTLDERVTHVLWAMPTRRAKTISRNGEVEPKRRRLRVGMFLKGTLSLCRELNVPIVDLSWLDQVSRLSEHEPWNVIDPRRHEPDFVLVVSAMRENRRKKKVIASWKERDNLQSSPKEEFSPKQDLSPDLGNVGSAAVVSAAELDWSGTPDANAHVTGRDAPACLSRSISETFTYLKQANLGLVEDDAITRAIELSLLDVGQKLKPSPYEILGSNDIESPVEKTITHIRTAPEKHLDNEEVSNEFEKATLAYRSVLDKGQEDLTLSMSSTSLKGAAEWDSELRDHQDLVRDLFEQHGADIVSNVSRQKQALKNLRLRRKEVGASNRNERNERIRNSCFYLSLAASYLDGIGNLSYRHGEMYDYNEEKAPPLEEADEAIVRDTALQLKRTIEAAVVSAHPEWVAQGIVGEEVQAFSDFLVYLMDSNTLVGDWAVAVFDEASGFVDIYKGKNYVDTVSDAISKSSTITLRYEPGHYQPLLPEQASSRHSLASIIAELDRAGVFYVVTDGAA